MSTFFEDLSHEEILGEYLNGVYQTLNLVFQRVNHREQQFQGIDLIYFHQGTSVYIDEKAQLHYVDKDLPTFTFELSYLKNNQIKQGWLFDPEKRTDFYFLITGIFSKEGSVKTKDDIKHCKITSVNRKKLIAHLCSLGLTASKLAVYDHEIRFNHLFGEHQIAELNPLFGAIHFTEKLNEKPINLKLRLDYLLDRKIAKRIYPIG